MERWPVYWQFQSTLPRGERRQVAIVRAVLYRHFNPRSHEGSDRRSCGGTQTIQNFNPRSHEGSDDIDIPSGYREIISIHAPTRGATICPISSGSNDVPFQSTLPRGERLKSKKQCTRLTHFNPRSHEGSD